MSISTATPTISPSKKIIRECVRPFKQISRKISGDKRNRIPAPAAIGASAAPDFANFHPHQCTVEPQGLRLLKTLVRESQAYRGPIIEIGTLLGITTTEMALAKKNGQQIIAVDNFCWNGWGLSPNEQFSLVKLSLAFLVDTGHVEICRIDKNEFYKSYHGPAPSLVFLDAMHDYEETKKDLIWAKEVGAKIICGHDYCDLFPGVVKVVDEFGGPRLLRESLFVL